MFYFLFQSIIDTIYFQYQYYFLQIIFLRPINYQNQFVASIYVMNKIKIGRQEKWAIVDGLSQYYGKISKDNLEMGDSGQSLAQFLSMKGIQPNQEGTGRIDFSQVKKIECLLIVKQRTSAKNKKGYEKHKKRIMELLSAFFQKNSSFLSQTLSCEDGKLSDQKKNLQYKLKRNKNRYDALQILDLLTQYKKNSSLLIAFIEDNLHQHGSDVYGRACGDGVAIIDLSIAMQEQADMGVFYQTLIHETLHTLGFDHCLQSACLMNPLVVGDLWLCPCCLKKLDSQLDLDLYDWVSRLKAFYQKNMKLSKKVATKSEKILDYLNTKLNSNIIQNQKNN